MALNNVGLGFLFTASNLASGAMGKINRDLKGLKKEAGLTGIAMNGAFKLAGVGITSLLAGLGTLGVSFMAASAAGKFEQELALVGELAHASGSRLDELREAAIEAGLSTKFSPDEAIEGLRRLITAGLDSKSAVEALTPSLRVATFGMISAEDASKAVVGSMLAFTNENLTATEVADKLAMAMARTNFQAEDFSVGLARVAGVAGSFNQSMDTTVMLLGLLRNRNIDASVAATSLREAIIRIGALPTARNALMKVLGTGREGVFLEGGRGGMRDMIDIIDDLQKSFQGLDVADQLEALNKIFGRRGIQLYGAVVGAKFRKELADGTTIMYRGVEAARALKRESESSAGMAMRLQRVVAEGNFRGLLELIKGIVQTIVIEFGRPMAAAFVPLLMKLRVGLETFARFLGKIPMPLKIMASYFILLSGVVFTLTGIVSLFAAALIFLAPYLGAIAITLGVTAVAAALFTAPLLVAIGALYLFKRAIELNVGGIGDYFRDKFEKVKLFFAGLSQLLSMGGFDRDLSKTLNRAENSGLKAFLLRIYAIYGRIREFFRGVYIGFSRLSERLGPIFGSFIGSITRLGQAFGFVDDKMETLASSDADSWADAGIRAADMLVTALEKVIRAGTWVFTTIAKVVEFFKTEFAPYASSVMEDWKGLFDELIELWGVIGDIFGAASSESEKEGLKIAVVFTKIAKAITFVIRVGTFFTKMTVKLLKYLAKAFYYLSYLNPAVALRRLAPGVADLFSKASPESFVSPQGANPEDVDTASSIIRHPFYQNQSIPEDNQSIMPLHPGATDEFSSYLGEAPFRHQFAENERLRYEQRDRSTAELMLGLRETLQRERQLDREARRQDPIELNLSIEGEPLLRAIDRQAASEQSRGFVPRPQEG